MFTENMIAPCGLDCSLCSQAHRTQDPCMGCLGPNANKPEFCSTWCGVIRCERRKRNHYRFCDLCPVYPCEHITERENRYASDYALTESPISNLRAIREQGMDAFLKEQSQAWTCASCGGVISVHDGLCSKCKKQHGKRAT
ncbi:DUF3795 domain-containing protein [Eubacteriales bacterium OttesenSCG-928-N13]|nr:DUF3795 domain-containing protein [Eubacteriales bacterium OttesenSCG-928-N13]